MPALGTRVKTQFTYSQLLIHFQTMIYLFIKDEAEWRTRNDGTRLTKHDVNNSVTHSNKHLLTFPLYIKLTGTTTVGVRQRREMRMQPGQAAPGPRVTAIVSIRIQGQRSELRTTEKSSKKGSAGQGGEKTQSLFFLPFCDLTAYMFIGWLHQYTIQ